MKEMPVQLQQLHYYPRFWELLVIVGTVAALLGFGYVIKRKWSHQNDSAPLPLALSMWFGMFLIYFLMAGALYYAAEIPKDYGPYLDANALKEAMQQSAIEAHHKLTVLVWCLLFWIVPMLYYSLNVVNSLAMRSIDRIGPFSAHIEDPSEFAAARKLALRGDIDGAVSMYRSYTDNQHNAMFEAARLLKAEDRYVEAALLFEEIADRFKHVNRVWAEASYHLAKIKETNLKEPEAAMVLYREIVKHASGTRFFQMARNDLARLQVLHEDFLEEIAKEDHAPGQDPFYVPRHIPAPPPETAKEEPAAPPDPFFKTREAASGDGKKAAKKAPAKKKPAAKKAPAKKKPAAKKKPSSR